MAQDMLSSSILQHIIDQGPEARDENGEFKLPPLDELASKFGVSRGKLREELIAAQSYGVVEMRPGDGTYVLPLDFYTPIRTVALYSVALDRENFDYLYELRVRLETSFWDKAARALTKEDKDELQRTLERAQQSLKGTPVEIPHREHRHFHLLIFKRLDNEFVRSLLRAYWDAYEAVGLHRYFDYSYYQAMWASHTAIADAIMAGQYDKGKEVLIPHFTLLQDRLTSRDIKR